MNFKIAEDYFHCEFLIRLPGYCPMPAFRDVIDVPLVVRRLHKPRKEVRKELRIVEDVQLVILNFGGQAIEDANKDATTDEDSYANVSGGVDVSTEDEDGGDDGDCDGEM